MENWISVKDNPPAYGQEVLVYPSYTGFKQTGVTSMSVYNSSKTENGIKFEYDNEHITHWMPLPEPPKIKKEI